MADKLMRTFVVMLFFLILALFSSCGTNGTSQLNAENSRQSTMQSQAFMTLTFETHPLM